MKIPAAPLQRILFGVAFCSLAAMGAGAIALATQPAASSGEPTSTQIEFVDPAADETVVEPVAAPVDETTAERAEVAAGRAETAAGRAEVAATHVDEVVATTTTTAVTLATTTGTVVETLTKPVLVGTIVPMEPETTTTTVAKRWVEIARIPAVAKTTPAESPLKLQVTLQTGQLRVTGPRLGGGAMIRPGDVAVWFGSDAVPASAYPATAENPGTIISWTSRGSVYEPFPGPWPIGDQTISVGQSSDNGWMAPWWTDSDLVIEEYR